MPSSSSRTGGDPANSHIDCNGDRDSKDGGEIDQGRVICQVEAQVMPPTGLDAPGSSSTATDILHRVSEAVRTQICRSVDLSWHPITPAWARTGLLEQLEHPSGRSSHAATGAAARAAARGDSSSELRALLEHLVSGGVLRASLRGVKRDPGLKDGSKNHLSRDERPDSLTTSPCEASQSQGTESNQAQDISMCKTSPEPQSYFLSELTIELAKASTPDMRSKESITTDQGGITSKWVIRQRLLEGRWRQGIVALHDTWPGEIQRTNRRWRRLTKARSGAAGNSDLDTKATTRGNGTHVNTT